MTIYFHKETIGFYDDQYYGEIDSEDCRLPKDCKKISQELYQSMLDGVAQGKIIQSDDSGYPILADRPVLSTTLEKGSENVS